MQCVARIGCSQEDAMRVKLNVVFLLSVFACIGLQTTAFAQCAVCEIFEGCYECGQGPEGGTSCFTNGCFRCRTTGVCPVLNAKTSLPKARLRVGQDVSTEIATRNPHLAAILSDLGRETTLRETYVFHLANVQLKAEDMEWWLNPDDQSSVAFTGVKEEAKRLKGSKPELLYDVSVKASPDSAFATLVIQQRNGSASGSPGSLLRVTLLKDTARWTVLNWEMK